jgi:hypothetical protein
MNNDKARRVRVRAVVAYPAVTVTLVVAIALALTPLGSSQVMAYGASTTPTDTATATSTPSPTSASATASASTSAQAPALSPTAGATPSPAPVPSVAPSLSPIAGPSSRGTVGPGAVSGDHYVLAWVEGPGSPTTYFPVDSSALNASQFQTFRVRFRVRNTGPGPLTTTPRLEYRPEGSTGYIVVPEKPLRGIPFHVTREWVPSPGPGGGTFQGPLGEDIAAADLRLGREAGRAVNGHHSMGANPDRPLTLPFDSYTEEEFTVTPTQDAPYRESYDFRITDGWTSLTGTDVATIRLGSPPVVRLSPGQRQGVAVGGPKPASRTGVVK